MILLLLPLTSSAAPAERWLSTDRVAIGIAEDGSLGDAASGLGLLFDPDGPKGPMPVGGDVLAVGRVFEIWSLSATVDGQPWQAVQAAPDGGSDLRIDPAAADPLEGFEVWTGQGEDEVVSVELGYALTWGRPLVWMVLEIQAKVDLQDLYLTRVFDPDLDDWATGSTGTLNAVGEGYAVASGAFDGRAWALAAAGGEGGICAWCTTADGVLAGSSESEGDDQLGLTVRVGDLAAGSAVRVVFTYGFGADADTAVSLAQEGAEEDPLGPVSLGDGGYEDGDPEAFPDPDELYGEDQPMPSDPVAEPSAASRGCATSAAGGSMLLALAALFARRRR